MGMGVAGMIINSYCGSFPAFSTSKLVALQPQGSIPQINLTVLAL